MNSILLLIILVPVIEIYLLIKIGSQIGAVITILLIFTTAIVGTPLNLSLFSIFSYQGT